MTLLWMTGINTAGLLSAVKLAAVTGMTHEQALAFELNPLWAPFVDHDDLRAWFPGADRNLLMNGYGDTSQVVNFVDINLTTGDDIFRTGHGDDRTFGNAGEDTIQAHGGSDTLSGGENAIADTFHFEVSGAEWGPAYQLGLIFATVSGLTAANFHLFTPAMLGLSAGFDWGSMDAIILNPSACSPAAHRPPRWTPRRASRRTGCWPDTDNGSPRRTGFAPPPRPTPRCVNCPSTVRPRVTPVTRKKHAESTEISRRAFTGNPVNPGRADVPLRSPAPLRGLRRGPYCPRQIHPPPSTRDESSA